MLSPQPTGMSNGKVSWGYSHYPQSYRHTLLKFKPILNSPLKKIVSETPAPVGVCTSKTWPFPGVCKNWEHSTLYGPKYCLPKKLMWVGVIPHRDLRNWWTKVHPTFFTERQRNRGKSNTDRF